MVSKAIAAEVGVAKEAKEARAAKGTKEKKIATKAEGDSIQETVTLVLPKINAVVEAIDVGPIGAATPKE